MKLTSLNQLIENGETLKGRWVLDPNHEVVYRKGAGGEEEAGLRASLVAAEPDALVLSVTEKKSKGRVVTAEDAPGSARGSEAVSARGRTPRADGRAKRGPLTSLLRLTGVWRTDEKNQITFEVEKESGKKDVLTFKGIWKVSKTNQLVYTYERKNLKRKTKELQTLVFKGTWKLSNTHELTYSLGVDSRSQFRFRGTFETTSLLAKAGEIRYQAGVEVEGKERIQTITLFGKWRLSRDLSLSFEVESEGGRKSALVFKAEYRIGKDYEISAGLKTQNGRLAGFELILTRDFLEKQGRGFFRLRKTLEESAVEAGVTLPW